MLGGAEFARRVLLLESGYLNNSLGHSVSCTVGILLEMLEKKDQDSWQSLSVLVDYFESDEGDILYCSCQEGKRKILSFVKTVSYKTVLILGTPIPLNPMTDLPLTRRFSRP